ncbi:MAG: 3-alpha,7-alpha,12-alpha-trihydroxy-5-beta-cholest-24-enoyl-CoA hydratase, partial [Deltaproteobacteria bacterium]|nr:3-alpha,7-alpha,12-alpha-trihydroxy-5-beta-cholest-24-enoyl-CoA hydratase [Deltaproteobacteria bacterium]
LIVDRSAGNFGGERGPKKEPIIPPEGKDPDFQVAYKIPPDQCALYRLSGDKVPLHIDPEFAKKSGMERCFFMGLGTMGYAGRAVLHSVCDSDPARLKSFSVRMVSIVYPGDTLITSGWKVEEGKYTILTTNQDGKVVLSNAIAEVT